jgi:gliding motility-associated-like protein
VHIIHNNGPENISDAKVIQAIQDLNDAFANSGAFQDQTGVDVEIEFCLAQRDPNGNATNGITRDLSPLTNIIMENDDINLKNINRWNPLEYMNIWVVGSITSSAIGPGVAGYAYLPSSHGLPEDGIVNEAQWFGSSSQYSTVHIHEVGHYLGLYHTFQGGCTNNNCMSDGDKVCDTPPDNSVASVSCSASVNTCSTDEDDISVNNPFRPVTNGGVGDQNDLTNNHMDYGDITCHNTFTIGQKDRMKASLISFRGSLLNTLSCVPACNNSIEASINASANTVLTGTTVNFTNNPIGSISNYEWSIDGVTFSNSTNSAFQFNAIGNFWVVLTVYNGDPNCTSKDSILIKVNCNPKAEFIASATNVNPGDQITFTSTTVGVNSYEWFVDGVSQSNAVNFTTSFPNIGGYMVSLVTCNTTCCDTSDFLFVKVGLCENKRGNVWCFGDGAGLDFNSGSPVPISTAINTNEGCSSISDKNGQLLFYTDGRTVYTNVHSVMSNGTGLWGHSSSTNSALIARTPGNDDIYYIFTTDELGGIQSSYPVKGALSYSIVDMSLNGGLGEVVQKNQVLHVPTSEKIAAVKHSNGSDIWIVTHKYLSNKFMVYPLTCNGLDTNAVVSQVGVNYSHYSYTAAALSISPNGKKLATAYATTNYLELFDFNPSTGVVTNPMLFSVPDFAYGTSFSPNSSKLYVSYFGSNAKRIRQYDVSLGTQATISASAVDVLTTPFSPGALQLAPDGRIYFSQFSSFSSYSDSLGAILNPNASGLLCAATRSVVYLGGNSVNYGLPNFVVNYVVPKTPSKIQGDTIICDISTFHISPGCDIGDSIAWEVQGASNLIFANDTSITIQPTVHGKDTLIAYQYASCGFVIDTLIIETRVGLGNLDIGNDTALCGTNFVLDAGAGYSLYSWSNGSVAQLITTNGVGTYWVEVLDTNGCILNDTIKVTSGSTMPAVDLGPDIFDCEGKVIPIDAGPGYYKYRWPDLSNGQSFTAWVAGKYWVEVVDSCGAISSDTLLITKDLSGGVDLGEDTVICQGDEIELDAGAGYTTYLWQDGSDNRKLIAKESDVYYVYVTSQEGCASSDTITIKTDCQNVIDFQDCEIGVPDAFSPNGDGLNDELRVLGSCIDELSMQIYNRWGQMVYEITNPSNSWDGKFNGEQLNNAVFAYKLKIKTFSGEEIEMKGNFSLIR